ncbi:Orf27 [Lactococcus raffinolactis 4877]|nr:Orf27 [Lactococcus raffinolactis 4877]
MSELKRPERYVHFESIKPELKEVTEFYTRKVTDYQQRLKQLNEYADALENEISVLKETPKVEVLLDDIDKPLVVVPQIIADAIESIPDYYSAYGAIKLIDMKLTELPLENEDWKYVHDWIFVDDNANKFVKAYLDGYTVEKPQLFYLKNKIKLEDVGSDLIGYLNLFLTNDGYLTGNINRAKKFTQQEIDSMQTGNYEQIEVQP